MMASQDEQVAVEGWTELSDSEVKQLHDHCAKVSLSMLLGTESGIKWHVHSGKEKETGMVSSHHSAEYGTVWKVECVLDCGAEKLFNSVLKDLDIDWIPHLDSFKILAERDNNYIVLQQITRGVTGVADREFVTIMFPGKANQTHYSLCSSVSDDHYEEMNHDCVRGEYFPGGWAWTPIGSGKDEKCLFTFIYSIDLKGYLPKRLVNWAAAGFLMKFVKAAQQQAHLVSKDAHKKNRISLNPTVNDGKK